MGVCEKLGTACSTENFPRFRGQKVVRSIQHSSRAYCQLAGYMLPTTKPTWNQTTPLTCRYSKKPEVATQVSKLGSNWNGHHQNHHKCCWKVFLSEAIHKPVISLTSGLKPYGFGHMHNVICISAALMHDPLILTLTWEGRSKGPVVASQEASKTRVTTNASGRMIRMILKQNPTTVRV